MFTGLVEAVGDIAAVETTAAGRRVRIATELAGSMSLGESLAVDGVCLTVVASDGDGVEAEVGPETARVTTLGAVGAGRRVNLERSMRADARLGGHFVQGHVDGLGRVRDSRADGDSHWLTISFDRALAPYLIRRGSIAVNGVSLTIAALAPDAFTVMIVPFTWSHTTLSGLRSDDPVNLECDMIGKYVARSLELLEEDRLRPATHT